MRWWARFRRDDAGAALVEFAIVLPLLLLMLAGILVWGYSLSLSSSMYDAARQGARQLAVGRVTEAAVEMRIEEYLSYWPQEFTVVAQDTNSTGTSDVIVTITTQNVMGNMFSFVPGQGNLEAEVVMFKEPL